MFLERKTRPLQGQSPYVINAGVNFNDPERQISGGLSFNQVGKRIVFVGTDVFPDLYEKARSVIDMQITSRMAKQGKNEECGYKTAGKRYPFSKHHHLSKPKHEQHQL